MTIGDRIRTERLRQGLTQAQCVHRATEAGHAVCLRTWSRTESGAAKRGSFAETLEAFAAGLDVSLAWLLDQRPADEPAPAEA